MHFRLPAWIKDWQPMKRTYCNIYFPRSRSEIKGIPQGADHVRGFTATGVFLDEACFLEGMDEVLAAVKPAIGKSGKFTAISSAMPSYFADLVADRV